MKAMKLMLAFAGTAAVVGGCTTTRNERPWLGQMENNAKGGVVYLDLVRADERPESSPTDDEPSVNSLTRGNWQPMVFTSPVDGIAAHRTYADREFLTSDTARQRGNFPTATTALELSGNTRMEQAAEAPLNLGIAVLDLLLMPARMVTHSPGREVYSFSEPYWRAGPTTLRRPLPGTGAVPTSSEVVPPGEAEVMQEEEVQGRQAVPSPAPPTAVPTERPEAPGSPR